ncbi:glycosyltransferase family 2 protein [Deinococcus saxicola]|uniref:glycosyltransferase family 2 protein n=1 Tax=Deinococcus saxicola TaxID=249406 RepID=UPI0039F00F7C
MSVMIAAYNEEVGIADTLRSILSQDVPQLQVIVVDDGSTDRTAEIARLFANQDERVVVIQQANGGKARALNNAIDYLLHPVAVSVDADSALAPGALAALARHFHDPQVGAVAGDVRVAGPATLLSSVQYLEYTVGQHLDKRAQDMLGAIIVVPGAAGAFRSDALRVLRYSHDTLTEDMDLTVALAAAGYDVRFETAAISYTEPPITVQNLWRQRMRWMYGTFQVISKHRHQIHHRNGRLAWLILVVGLILGGMGPWLDLLAVAMLVHHSSQLVVPMLLNLGADFVVAGAALALGRQVGRQGARALLLTPAQRLFMRPFVLLAVIMTCVMFLRRRNVSWNKLPRVGLQMTQPQQAHKTAGD